MCASSQPFCKICGAELDPYNSEAGAFCPPCSDRAESLFDEEMRRVELIRTIRGIDVELYDIKHPDSSAEARHCGQVVLIRAGEGFEVKICLRVEALDWSVQLTNDQGFSSQDTRLDALIGNLTLLIESWGGGPHYMDIFYIERALSVDADL